MISTDAYERLSLPSLPLLQRLELLDPLPKSLEPVNLKDAAGRFRLIVRHLPKLAHLSLCHGCGSGLMLITSTNGIRT
jgi:hypothetical protein